MSIDPVLYMLMEAHASLYCLPLAHPLAASQQIGNRMSTEQKLLCARPRTAAGILASLLIGSVLLTSGCSWGKKNQSQTLDSSQVSKGSWLCEAGKAVDDWDCIQSEDIEPQLSAANKAAQTRSQPPTPAQEELPATTTETAADALGNPLNATIPPNLPATPAPIIDPEAASRAPADAPRPLTTARAERPSEPAYAQLAYRPDEPVRIVDLPEEFYAAQLLAVSTKKQIEDFVVAQNLYNMSAARIEQNGQVLYVLLLGVYESKEIAQSAVAVMPTEVQNLKPWVRPIEGLQDAMMRGDQLAATAGIQ